MKFVFLGTGESCDEDIPNTSILVLSNKTTLLLDCGYSVPRQLWKYNPDQSFIDTIYISHTHADHYFGIPPLLIRMWEKQRKKPLTIICQRGVKSLIEDLIEYGYRGFSKKFQFDLNFIEVKEGQTVKFNEQELSFAPTEHSVPNLAIKVKDEQNSFCYSGDGEFNKKTEELYKNSDLVIHESYLCQKKKVGHSRVVDLIEMAKRNNIKYLALVHFQRDLAKKRKFLKKKTSKKGIKIIIPEPFEELNLNES